MMNEWLLFVVVGCVVAWLAVRHALAVVREKRHLEIMHRGQSCQGTVVGIQHPFMLDSCTRLYFDFVPQGRSEPLRACHIAHHPPEQVLRALPAAGSSVTIAYLPDRPTQAVIARLIGESRT